MEGRGVSAFEKGRFYTRRQINGALGGSWREALPTKDGKVVCVCLTRRMNPRAPDEITIGAATRLVARARAFADSRRSVPVFVSERASAWEYVGDRRVRSVIEEPGALLALVAEGAPADVSLALVLEEPPAEAAGAVGAGSGASAGPPQG